MVSYRSKQGFKCHEYVYSLYTSI